MIRKPNKCGLVQLFTITNDRPQTNLCYPFLEVQPFYKMISRPLNCKEVSDVPSSFCLMIRQSSVSVVRQLRSHGRKWNVRTQKKNM